MTVQAQYPSNLLLLSSNQNEQERKNQNMDFNTNQKQTTFFPATDPITLLDNQSPSPLFFPNGNGGGSSVNTRKRGRDSNPMPTSNQQGFEPINLFSSQSQQQQQQQQQQQRISFYQQLQQTQQQTIIQQQQQHQKQQRNSTVSTGLRLSFIDDQQYRRNPFLCGDNSDLNAQIKFNNEEIDRFLNAQGEQLRRLLEEIRKKHYRGLISAIESSATRMIQERQSALQRETKRNNELEKEIILLRTELGAFQAKCRADETSAAALQAQLQNVVAAVEDPVLSDEGSACVDRRRETTRGIEHSRGVCRICWSKEATVVVFPCRHLCVCKDCDGEAACPVCSCVRTASVQVYLS